MFVRSFKNQSQSKWLILFSFMMAIVVIFSMVQLMAADSGRTAVFAPVAQQNELALADTITPTNILGPTGVVTTYTLYMPIMFKAMEITISDPTSANQWTISWDSVPGATGYVIQQSNDPAFTTLTNEVPVGAVNSYQLSTALSFDNIYYHRVKPLFSGFDGPWSNTVMFIGGYRDDFSDDTSGWVPARRMTFLEETVVRYGSGSEAGNLIIIVADRWDWLIGSPLKPAPEPPYAIQFRARVHDASNLVSGGVVLGGDWNGQACPEIGNVYQTTNCFNQFYNFNMIFYGPMKLLHEQVDSLVWCPNCGGSPIKRIGPTQGIDPILANGPSLDYHTYRIEVRDSGVKFFVDDSQKATFSNTSYINRPYFGVFASTDEYKPSIWFYDYYQVTRID